MHIRLAILVLIALMALISVGRWASASDAVDTRVTFALSDNDVLKNAEESGGESPSLPNSQPSRQNRLFYDNYDRRDTGFENLSHLVLYMHEPGFFTGVDTEAALVMRAEILDERDVLMQDDGTYLKLAKTLGDMELSATAFPISADRFRLGYSYDISWGGSRIFRFSKAAPGLRVQLSSARGYAFVGAKTGLSQQKLEDGTIEKDTVWGALAGAGLDVLDELKLEMGAGFFHRGVIEKAELQVPNGAGRLRVAPWQGFGASAQVSYHVGMSIGTAIDFRLYKNDPNAHETFFRQEKYGEGLSFALQSEVSVLGQTLQDPEKPASTVIQPAVASDLHVKLKLGKARVQVLLVYRDLNFIRFNVPSVASFMDHPDGIPHFPEWFGSLSADYFLTGLHLTPGVSFGIQRPAHNTGTVTTGVADAAEVSQQTFVYRSETDLEILNPGEKVALIYAGRANAKWDLSEGFSAVCEVQVSYDPNRRQLDDDLFGYTNWVKQDPWIVGFNMLLQARF